MTPDDVISTFLYNSKIYINIIINYILNLHILLKIPMSFVILS